MITLRRNHFGWCMQPTCNVFGWSRRTPHGFYSPSARAYSEFVSGSVTPTPDNPTRVMGRSLEPTVVFPSIALLNALRLFQHSPFPSRSHYFSPSYLPLPWHMAISMCVSMIKLYGRSIGGRGMLGGIPFCLGFLSNEE